MAYKFCLNINNSVLPSAFQQRSILDIPSNGNLRAYRIASLKIVPIKSPHKLQKCNNNNNNIGKANSPCIIRGSQLTVGAKEFCIKIIEFKVM